MRAGGAVFRRAGSGPRGAASDAVFALDHLIDRVLSLFLCEKAGSHTYLKAAPSPDPCLDLPLHIQLHPDHPVPSRSPILTQPIIASGLSLSVHSPS